MTLVWLVPARSLLKLCAGLVLAVVATRTTYAYLSHDWIAPYFLSWFRADSLLLGGLVASLCNQITTQRLRLRRTFAYTLLLFATGLVALKVTGVASFGRDGIFMQTAGYTCLGIVFSALVGYVALADKQDRCRILFETPVLRFFGKYSYALYLFHPFVQTFVKNFEGRIAQALASIGAGGLLVMAMAAATLAISVAMALASWHLYEKQFLKLKVRFS